MDWHRGYSAIQVPQKNSDFAETVLSISTLIADKYLHKSLFHMALYYNYIDFTPFAQQPVAVLLKGGPQGSISG